MSGTLWVVLMVVVWMIHIPIIRLSEVHHIAKYQMLRYLAMGTFGWGVLIVLQNVFQKGLLVYLPSILIYPTVFILATTVFRVSFLFTSRTLSMSVKRITQGLVVINVLMALTNSWHQLYIQVPYDATLTLERFNASEFGVFFYVHTTLAYAYLIIAFIHLLGHLYLRRSAPRYQLFFSVITASIVFGLAINVMHVFVYSVRLDPTFLFMALVTLALYFIMYKNDVDLALLNASQRYMLSHMREMTLLFNDQGKLVNASQSIETDLGISIASIQDIDTFYKHAEAQGIVLFDTFDALKERLIDTNNRYINQEVQVFPLERLGVEGTIVLLYDETEIVTLMHELNIARRTDMMTHTYNRNHFEQSLEALNQDAFMNGVIMFDLNYLKRTNDAFGHHAGDRMIRRFVDAIKKATEARDGLIFRMGGDEFLYVERNVKDEALQAIVSKLTEFNAHHPLNALAGFAYGIALRKPNELFERLIIRADDALYRHKAMARVDEEQFEQRMQQLDKDPTIKI